jgi:hypothetical protein
MTHNYLAPELADLGSVVTATYRSTAGTLDGVGTDKEVNSTNQMPESETASETSGEET